MTFFDRIDLVGQLSRDR